MPSYNPAAKGVEYIIFFPLFAQADDQIKTSPSISAGDFQVSTDGSALSNLDTLPAETPASSGIVKFTLSAAEMTGDNVVLRGIDPDNEWHSFVLTVPTVAAGQQFDDLSTLDAAAVNAEVDTALADYDGPTKAELDAGLAALDVVAAASVATPVSAGEITMYRGTTWVIALTGLGNISAYDTLFFSVKENPGSSEDNAILRVRYEAGTTTTTVERVQKAAPADVSNATITIDDATAGDITIRVEEEETANIGAVAGLYYDIKGADDNGLVTILSYGIDAFNVIGDITRAIT